MYTLYCVGHVPSHIFNNLYNVLISEKGYETFIACHKDGLTTLDIETQSSAKGYEPMIAGVSAGITPLSILS